MMVVLQITYRCKVPREEKSEDITKQLAVRSVFANAIKTIARKAENAEVLPRLVGKAGAFMKMRLPSTAGIAPTVLT